MFVKDLDKFEKGVVETIHRFFNMEPQELKNVMERLENEYGKLYDLNVVSIKNVRTENKDAVMLYKTMKYFHNIYVKMQELKECICEV